MPNNINISSGSDFSKKKFGSITKLTKPTFIHNGKVFSNNTFKNQRTIPLLENNIYYVNHGLEDPYTIYEEIFGFFGIDYLGMSIPENLISFIQSLDNINPIQQRASLSSVNAVLSTFTGANSQANMGANPFDPYDNNPPDPPQCRPI